MCSTSAAPAQVRYAAAAAPAPLTCHRVIRGLMLAKLQQAQVLPPVCSEPGRGLRPTLACGPGGAGQFRLGVALPRQLGTSACSGSSAGEWGSWSQAGILHHRAESRAEQQQWQTAPAGLPPGLADSRGGTATQADTPGSSRLAPHRALPPPADPAAPAPLPSPRRLLRRPARRAGARLRPRGWAGTWWPRQRSAGASCAGAAGAPPACAPALQGGAGASAEAGVGWARQHKRRASECCQRNAACHYPAGLGPSHPPRCR